MSSNILTVCFLYIRNLMSHAYLYQMTIYLKIEIKVLISIVEHRACLVDEHRH